MSRKPQLLLVEGPDGSGKTTLVDYLARTMGGFSKHFGVPRHHPMVEYVGASMDALRAVQRPDCSYRVFFDRFHLGEQVYGPLMRQGDLLGLKGRLVLEDMLAHLFDPLVIVCLPPFHVCLEAWQRRHTDEYVKDQDKFHDVWHAFTLVSTTLPLVRYDYTSDTVVKIVRYVT